MNVIFIEKIKDWLQKPIIERSHGEELLGCLVIAVILGLIWLIGELVYRWEDSQNDDTGEDKDRDRKHQGF